MPILTAHELKESWPKGRQVGIGTIHQSIAELRSSLKSLGAGSTLICTVGPPDPKGYRLNVNVQHMDLDTFKKEARRQQFHLDIDGWSADPIPQSQELPLLERLAALEQAVNPHLVGLRPAGLGLDRWTDGTLVTGQYLTHFDAQIERDLGSYESWMEHLVLSLLFQPRLCAHDSLIFGSARLYEHLFMRGEQYPSDSLFFQLVQHGLFVPSFRDSDRTKWKFSLAVQLLQQQNAMMIHPRAEQTGEMLDRAWGSKSHPEDHATFFPRDSAVRFGNTLQKLTLSDPRSFRPQLKQLGATPAQANRSWTYIREGLGFALQEAQHRGQDGCVARKDVYLGMLPVQVRAQWKEKGFESPDAIAAACGKDQFAVKLALSLVNAAYPSAQAGGYADAVLYPDVTPEARIILGASASPQSGSGSTTRIELRVPLPSKAILCAIPAKELLRVRAELGSHFIKNLASWQGGTKGRAQLEQDAISYAESICVRAERLAKKSTRQCTMIIESSGQDSARQTSGTLLSDAPSVEVGDQALASCAKRVEIYWHSLKYEPHRSRGPSLVTPSGRTQQETR